ncbi:MgtC/SapB family protein [Spirochaetota bacterium]
MNYISLFKPFIISLILGALLGLERAFATRGGEYDANTLGGVRTFSLLSLLGCLASYVDNKYQPGILIISFVGILILTGISYFVSYTKDNERGITTEISLLLCFVIGVVVQHDQFILATFITVFVVLILHLRDFMNKMMTKIDSHDIRAILKFAIITFVILPVFDPKYAVYIKDIGKFSEGLIKRFPEIVNVELINPHTVWLMVVLISGIGFTGYLATKILGSQKGIGLTGFLGGLVSSTATTLTFSRRSKEETVSDVNGSKALSVSFALAILLACSTMFPRILVEVLIVNSDLLKSLSVTMGLMSMAGFMFCLAIWKKTKNEKSDEVPLKNPFNIMPAVKFGLLYAGIVLLTRVIEVMAGESGIYVVSIISGLTDVDAITLTMSQISKNNPMKLNQASIAITLAAFSNTFLKAGMVFALGSKELRKTVLIGFTVIISAGICGLLLLLLL